MTEPQVILVGYPLPSCIDLFWPVDYPTASCVLNRQEHYRTPDLLNWEPSHTTTRLLPIIPRITPTYYSPRQGRSTCPDYPHATPHLPGLTSTMPVQENTFCSGAPQLGRPEGGHCGGDRLPNLPPQLSVSSFKPNLLPSQHSGWVVNGGREGLAAKPPVLAVGI